MTDKAIRHLTTAAVLLVAAIAAVISFIHIRHLALSHGQDALSAALLPLSIDGLVAAMSGVMLRAARLENVSTPWLARPMLFLGVGATLAANLAYGAAYGVVGALVSGWPAVAFVGCVEVSVAMVRRTRPVTETAPATKPAVHLEVAPQVPTDVVSAASEPKRVTSPRHRNDKLVRLLLSSPDMTEPEVASKAGCSVSTVSRQKKRLREAAMANGNGKAY